MLRDPCLESDGNKSQQRLNIGLFILCHNFQSRLKLVLSSIVQQINSPDLFISIASTKNNGNPNTEEIIEFYQNLGLNIKFVEIDEDKVKKRGYVRNKQLENVSKDLDFYYFMDSDHVYPNNWFSNISKNLLLFQDSLFFDSKFIITQIDSTEEFIKNNSEIYIENVYDKCLNIPKIKITNRDTGAGNCQIVSKVAMTKLENKYINYYEEKDWVFKSDRWFRNRICNIGLSKFNMKKLLDFHPIHLNHYRNRTSENTLHS